MTTPQKNTAIIAIIAITTAASLVGAIRIQPAWIEAAVQVMLFTVIAAVWANGFGNIHNRGPVPLTWRTAVIPIAMVGALLTITHADGTLHDATAVAFIVVFFLLEFGEIGAAARGHKLRAGLTIAPEPGERPGVFIGTAIEPIKPGEPVSAIEISGSRYVHRSRDKDANLPGL